MPSRRDKASSTHCRWASRALIVALALFGCREDVVSEMPPPMDAELAELYGELCSRSVECTGDPVGYETVAACTDAQIDYYTQFSDACLNAAVEYHECLIDVPTCTEFNWANGPLTCRALRAAARDACGGVSL
jgi:hypothetical protein